MSARSTSSSRGRRAKVAGPAKRGTSVASTGPTGPSLMRANVHRAGRARTGLAASLRSDGVQDVQAGGATSGQDRGQHSRDRGEDHEERQLKPGDRQHVDALVGDGALEGYSEDNAHRHAEHGSEDGD